MSKYEQHAKRLADLFIAQLGNPDSRWNKDWSTEGIEIQPTQPYNPTTGKAYKGGNNLGLKIRQWDLEALGADPNDSRWMTYKQAQAIGAHVRPGEKGTWCLTYQEVKEGVATEPDAENKRMIAIPFCVFHASQIDGLPPRLSYELAPLSERLTQAHNLILDLGAKVNEIPSDRAFYNPATDQITVPLRNQFTDHEAWMSVLLHEAGHATGHKSRLDREFVGSLGDIEQYAREELRAEMASFSACERLGIVNSSPKNHFGYVNNWIKVLQSDPKEIMRASRDAEKICDFLKIPELEYEVIPALTQEQQQERIDERKAEKQREKENVMTMPPPPVAVEEHAVTF